MTIFAKFLTKGKDTLSTALRVGRLLLYTFFITSIASAESGSTEPIDAVLLLDGSGSMLLTDPQKLRLDGARTFIDGLKDSDRIALVEFAETAKEIRGLTDRTQSDAVKLDLAKVGDTGEYTDLLVGIQKAREVLVRDGRTDARKVVVLISDGKMDPKPEIATPEAQTQKLFSEEIPGLKTLNIEVHTLAFSDLADQKLLADVAALTGGSSRFAPDASGLAQAFAGLTSAVVVKPKEEVKAPEQKQEVEKAKVIGNVSKIFPVAEGIEQVTFYINRGESSGITITSPTGQVMSADDLLENTYWFKGEDFDLVTVNKPDPGDWGVAGIQSKENFATALTNLKLAVEWSSNEVSVDEPVKVEAKFFESRKPITLPQLSRTLTYSFQVIPTDRISEPIIRGTLHDDGEAGDSKADDGVYAAEFTLDEAGAYRLLLNAQGPTLSREHQANFKVTPRLLTLSLFEGAASSHSGHESSHGDKNEHEEEESNQESSTEGEESLYFRIALSPSGQAVRERIVKLKATNSGGATFTISIPGVKNEQSEFMIPVNSLPSAGTYEIQAQLGGSLRGRLVSARSNSISYTYTGPEQVINLEENAAKKTKKKISDIAPGFPIGGIFFLTLINGLCAMVAMNMLKKGLANVVVEEERYVPPEAAIKMIAELDKRVAVTELNLTSPAFAPDKIEKILAAAAMTESDLQGAAAKISSEEASKPQDTTIVAPAEPPTLAEVAAALPPEPITPAEANEKVESEVDDETKKLLEQLGQQLGTDKE